jgi:hypothetical protein
VWGKLTPAKIMFIHTSLWEKYPAKDKSSYIPSNFIPTKKIRTRHDGIIEKI